MNLEEDKYYRIYYGYEDGFIAAIIILNLKSRFSNEDELFYSFRCDIMCCNVFVVRVT